MGARRRGFALILALVTASMVFAIGVRASTASRSAMVEAGAQVRLHERERLARSAVSIALASIARLASEPVEQPGADPAQRGASEPINAPEIPEMPPAMRQLLGQLQDENGDADSALQTGQETRRIRSRRSMLDALQDTGLPSAALDLDCLGNPVSVRLVDASGLLNVNRATNSELTSLLLQCGIDNLRARRIAAEIIDYRDEDDFVSPGGAEAPAYARRGYEIANADIVALEELFFLPSMTRTVFRRIEPYLTTVGSGRVHAPTAPREVLASVDSMTPAAVERLMAARDAATLTDETLRRALEPMSTEALDRFSLRPSGYLRASVSTPGVQSAIRVELVVSDVGGVRFVRVGPE